MQWCPLLKLFRNKQKHTVSYLVDLILCGLQRLDDGLQLDFASNQALLQLILLLLQPAQVGLCPAQLFLLALQVWLLGVYLTLEGRDLEAEENEAMWKGSKMNTRHITKGPLFFHNMSDTWLSSLWHHFSCLLIIVGITFAFSRTAWQAPIPKSPTLTITLSVKKCQRWKFLPFNHIPQFFPSSSPSETLPGTSYGFHSACPLIYASAGPSPPGGPGRLVSEPPAPAGWLSLCPGHSASPIMCQS